MDDILKKLLQSEHEAAGLVQSAEAEAFQRVTKVKAELQSKYSDQLRQRRIELDAELKDKQAKLLQEREEKNLAYEQELARIIVYKEDFRKKLRTLLQVQ